MGFASAGHAPRPLAGLGSSGQPKEVPRGGQNATSEVPIEAGSRETCPGKLLLCGDGTGQDEVLEPLPQHCLLDFPGRRMRNLV